MIAEFTVKDWSAFAPGLVSKDAWLDWAQAPSLPLGEATPALLEMPAMQRRRVETLGRMALQVAYWCQQDAARSMPCVFACRHGDLSRTYDMLQTLARDEPLSPTQFGLSTHNAIAAQYSIAQELIGNSLSVSAGVACAEAAVVEALGLLADGASEVLIVVYDCPIQPAYCEFQDEPEAAFAWAARLAKPSENDARLSLSVGAEQATDASTGHAEIPHSLEVLRFLIGSQPMLELQENTRQWRWQRHA